MAFGNRRSFAEPIENTKRFNKAKKTLARLIELGIFPAGTSFGQYALNTELLAPHDRKGDFNAQEEKFIEVFLGGNRPAYYIKTRALSDQLISQPSQVRLVSGVCLFGATGLKGIFGEQAISLTNPKDVPALSDPNLAALGQIIADPRLSLYELESVMRLGGLLGALARGEVKVSSIALHIPRIEYYLYAFPLLEAGLMSAEQFELYRGYVDQRAARVERLFGGAVGRFDPEKGQVVAPLQALEQAGIFERPDYSCRDAAGAGELLAGDPLWKRLLEAKFGKAGQSAERLTWGSLCEASYVYAYLQTAKKEDGSLGIAVDNVDEDRIMAETKRVLTAPLFAADDYNLIGLYPKELTHVDPASSHVFVDHLCSTLLYYCGAMLESLDEFQSVYEAP